jgi:hypothetical protein
VAAAQGRPDVLRGRVVTDSGVAIVGADVIVTMAPGAETFRERTDAAGRYAITIPDGTGEYLVYIGILGRRPFRRRVTRASGDSALVVDATLPVATATLATVRVQARRPRPARSLGTDASPGTVGTDRTVDGIVGALPPEQLGNIDSLATLVPGLAVTAAGVQAFGLGADANARTLNGLTFDGAELPRDARTTTRFSTSPWDPTRGGFSGALAATTLAAGGNISGRTGRLTVDAPALQVGDPVAARTRHQRTG